MGTSRLAWVALACIAALAALHSARAHDGAPTSFASITVAGSRVLYALTTSNQALNPAGPAAGALANSGVGTHAAVAVTTLLARQLRIEADGKRCLPGAADYEPPVPPKLSTTYRIEFRCDAAPIGTLRVTNDSFDRTTGRGSHTLLRVGVEEQEAPLAPAVLLGDENRSAEFTAGSAADGVPDRWMVAFTFGLIHGFGFSNVLREIGLPQDALLTSLLWFNLGIEAGQLLVLLLLVAALGRLARLRPSRSVPRALSALLLAVSVALLLQRL